MHSISILVDSQSPSDHIKTSSRYVADQVSTSAWPPPWGWGCFSASTGMNSHSIERFCGPFEYSIFNETERGFGLAYVLALRSASAISNFLCQLLSFRIGLKLVYRIRTVLGQEKILKNPWARIPLAYPQPRGRYRLLGAK